MPPIGVALHVHWRGGMWNLFGGGKKAYRSPPHPIEELQRAGWSFWIRTGAHFRAVLLSVPFSGRFTRRAGRQSFWAGGVDGMVGWDGMRMENGRRVALPGLGS